MKKILLYVFFVLILLFIIFGSCALYNIRDRHSGYELDLILPDQPVAGQVLSIGVGKMTITPKLEDTWVDADSNARFEPEKGDSYIDHNNNGKFDAFWLAGFSQNRPAAGIHDDIWARAVVWDDGRLRIALVVIDAIGFFHDDVVTIRKKIAETDLDIDHVIISSTHVHEVPDLMGLWGPAFYKSGVNQDYLELVQNQTIAAIRQAVHRARPAYIKLAKIDSTAQDLVGDTRPPIVLDNSIHLMQFCDVKTDSVFGIFMNWGNHPETVGSDNLMITADFCHYWIKGLEEGIQYEGKILRPGIGGTAIFANGAVGGLMTSLQSRIHDPWLNRDFRKSSFEKARAQGHRLADLVLNSIEQDEWTIMKTAPITLKAKTFQFKVQNNIFKLAGCLGIFNRGFVSFGRMRSEINLLTIGDAWILTIPGEINPEIVNGGIETPEGADYPGEPTEIPPIRELMHGKYNFVIGLANDEVGYIMPKSHWDTEAPFTYGRKKAFYGEINSLGPDAAPILYEQIRGLLKK